MRSVFTLCILSIFSIVLFAQQKPLQFSPTLLHERLNFNLSAAENSINLCGLLPSDTYQLTISTLNKQTTHISLGAEPSTSSTLSLVATAACTTLFFTFDKFDTKEKHLTLSVSRIKKKNISPEQDKVLASITTAQNSDVASLIQDVFIGGNCFDVAGTTFSGAAAQLGSFGNGSTSINIEDGVIISTGNIGNSVGPNNSPDVTTGFGIGGVDSDLDAISSGGNLFDIAKIEFDFTPTEDQITFEYAFASDEYCEYANTQFNDVFGFFISGPGINGPFSNNGENIAIIPTTGENVAINSVNHLSNTSFYLDNAISEGCGSGNPVAPNDIEFDGFTVVLTAVANVIPCETYHIKLIIADRGDAIYDSAVFLKANSFGGGIDATASSEIIGHAGGELAGYEGCSDAAVTFIRTGNDLSEDVIIGYTIGSNSTATEGVDYSPLPNSVIIPAGQSSVTITIEIYNDLITEGMENIFIELEQSCSCSGSVIEIQILEPPPIEVVFDDLEVCRDELSTITPTVSGGIAPYSYQWSDGSSGETLDVSVGQPTTFTLTVADDCVDAEASTFTVIPIFPTAQMSGEGSICQGSEFSFLDINLTGNAPWDITYSVNGTDITIQDIQVSPFPILVDQVGDYELVSVLNADGCPGDVSGEGLIEENVIDVIPTLTQISCFGMNDGAVQLEVLGGTAPYTYEWIDNNLPAEPNIDNLPAGAYFVTVTDDRGCNDIIVAFIDEPDELLAEVTEIINIDCITTAGSVSLEATGGNGPYSFVWEDGTDTQMQNDLPAGTYNILVTDDADCETSLEAIIEESVNYPTAVATPVGIIDCYTATASITSEGSSTGNVFYQWLAPNGAALPDLGAEIDVFAEGTYTLIVTDASNNCATEATAEVLMNIAIPTAIANGEAILNCNILTTNLDGLGSAEGANISYLWNTTDGNILSGADGLSPQVDAPGTYTLIVLDTENGCSSLGEVIVEQNIVTPDITLQNPETITCVNTELDITSAGSDAGAVYAYEWSTVDGIINGATDTTFINVSTAATYTLSINNILNGCVNTMDIEVPLDTALPLADAGGDIELDCLGSAVNLDGDASLGPNFVYEWTTMDGAFLSGEQSLSPETAIAGTYTLMVTNTENGCISLDDNLVFNNTGALSVVANVDDILNCNNASVEVSSSLMDGSSNYTALWSSLESNPIDSPEGLNIVVDAPGTYAVQITNLDNGCISFASVEVAENMAIPFAEAGDNQLVNCFETSTILDATGTDTGNNFSTSWTNPDGSTPLNANDLQLQTTLSGTFSLTVVNTENGCQSTDEVTVNTDFAYPTVEAGGDMTLNCAINNVSLNGTADANGHDFDFEWQELVTNTIVSTTSLNNVVDVPGIYLLSVLDTENGCLTLDTLDVLLDIEIPIADAAIDEILNCNNTSVLLSSAASSQGNNITYEWTNLAQNSIFSSETTPSVNLPGNYQLVVNNIDNFCIDTAFVSVEQDIEIPIAAIATPDILTCSALTALVDASNSSTGTEFLYQWTLPNGDNLSESNIPSIIVEEEGSYHLIVLNTVNGCSQETNIMVESFIDFPTVEAGPAQLINCYTSQVELNPEGSTIGNTFIYEWQQNGIQLSQSPSLEMLAVVAPGEYELIITNTDNDCSASDTVMVNIDIEMPLASAGIAATLDCEQTTLNLDASQSSSGLAYAWNTVNGEIIAGNNTQTPLISSPGTYVLQVINMENGCDAFDQVNIAIDTIHPAIQIGLPDLLTCDIITVNLEGSSNGDYVYTWVNENQEIVGNSTIVSVNSPGNYQFIAVNLENECVSTMAIDVNQNITPPLAVAEGEILLTCITTSLQLNGSQSSGNSTYQWTTDNGNIQSGSTGLSPIINNPGMYTLQVIDNFNGCEAFDVITVEEDVAIPIALAAPDGLLTCMNMTVELQGESNAGLPLQYEWQNTSGEIISTNNVNTSVSTPGNYQFYVVNEANGCENSITISVAQNIETPVADAGEAGDLTCVTTNLTLNGSVISANGGNYTYEWTGPIGGILFNENTANPVVQSAGEYTLVITNQDNGCEGLDMVSVDLIAPIGIDVNIQQPLCHGDPAFLDIQTVEGGASPYVYSINGGGSFVQNSNFSLLSPGWHLVVVQDANGCEYVQGVQMENIPELEVNIESLATIKLGEAYQFDAVINIPEEEIAAITWTPATDLSCTDCLDPLASPFLTTDYQIQVTNINGCQDEAQLRLIVDRRPDIYIPNVFSPNGDGTNDIFYIFAKTNAIKNINVLQIYSRWGEPVFEIYNFQPNDPQFGWNGMYRATDMNAAVFTYWTEIEMIDGETIIMKGDVTIIR